MTQGERVKEVRKTLGLTLEKFGEKVGVTKTAISRIEKDERNCTEQMVKSICREFNVDYTWLTTGDGDMFVLTDDLLCKISCIVSDKENPRYRILDFLVNNLDDNDIAALNRIINKAIIFQKEVTYDTRGACKRSSKNSGAYA